MITAREFGAYTTVGTTAAGVNMAFVAGAVPLGLSPLVANAVGFVIGFLLGFAGHVRWSFPAVGRPVAPAMGRFAALSILGFGLNEVAYAATLGYTSLDYRLALLLVITGLGLLKLVISKYWAFAHS
jgi:putative flippase GtrA